jgi:uncharacterized phage infection (PIP) family protein YhgE
LQRPFESVSNAYRRAITVKGIRQFGTGMDRRRFISLVAVAGTPALAGCSNPLGDDDEGSAERDPENEVRDALYTAVGELNTAALALGVASEELDDPSEAAFEAAGPRERVNRANDALDAAAAADTEAHEAEIENAHSYAATIESMIEAFVSLLAGAEDLSELDGEFDPESVDELRTVVESSRDPLSTAASASESAESALSSADDAVLSDLDAEVDRVADALADLGGYAAGFDQLSLGYLSVFDGVDTIDAAEKRFEKESYADAQSSFASASDEFQAAKETFQTEGEEPPEDVAERLSRGVERSDALYSLSDGYTTVMGGMTTLETGQEQFEAEEYEQASTTFADASSSFEAANGTFEAADGASSERIQERLTRGVERSGSLHALSGGYATLVDGMTDLETGQEQFENEQYERAAALFDSAGTSFEQADQRFATEPAPEDEFDERFERARCRSGHLVEGAQHLEDAADAADSGNLVRAKEQAEQGEQEVEDAKNC